MFPLLLLLPLAHSFTYDPSIHSLGYNIINNHNFETPSLAGSESQFYSLGIQGWNCTVDCQVVDVKKRCANAPLGSIACLTSFKQAVDIDSDFVMDHYIQNIHIKDPGLYYLLLKWQPPTYQPLGKHFGIKANNTQVGLIEVLDSNYSDHTFETTFEVSEGIMALDIFEANTINDTFGCSVGLVEVRRIIYLDSLSSILGPFSALS